MPEKERRAAILDAVARLLGRGGVNAVTMRDVAAEAGVSLRLVQYYGKSKDELLTAALDRLAARSVERWHARAEQQPTEQPTSARIKAFFDEALPTDEASRTFHRIGVSLELLTVTQAGAAAQAYRTHLGALADHLAGILRAGTRLDATSAHQVASEVMALAHGLGTLLMAGQITQPEADSLVDDYLARLRPRLSD